MRLLAFAALMLPALAVSPGDVVGDIVVQGDIRPLNIVPTFDHGYLGVYDAQGVSVYKPDGSLAMKVSRQANSSIDNVDMDVDGSVVAAISHSASGGTIAIFNPDGSLIREIVTSPYIPSQLCFAPDHSIWVVGSLLPRSQSEPVDFALLRHYARSGELLGQFFPLSTLAKKVSENQMNVGLWRIRVTKDRIGMALSRNAPPGGYLWLEAGLDGKEIGHWEIPRGKHPAAMMDDGQIYAVGDSLSVLDRTTGRWEPVPAAWNDNLLGAEANSLVYMLRGGNILTRRVPVQ